jgi:hypothetical protein
MAVENAEKVSTGRKAAPNEPTKSEAKTREVAEEVKPQSYVWLANGEVVRAYNEDLPGSAGNAHPFGFWQKDGNVYQIVGVYPTEDKAEE